MWSWNKIVKGTRSMWTYSLKKTLKMHFKKEPASHRFWNGGLGPHIHTFISFLVQKPQILLSFYRFLLEHQYVRKADPWDIIRHTMYKLDHVSERHWESLSCVTPNQDTVRENFSSLCLCSTNTWTFQQQQQQQLNFCQQFLWGRSCSSKAGSHKTWERTFL